MTYQYRIVALEREEDEGDEMYITLADPTSGRRCGGIFPAGIVLALDAPLQIGDLLPVSDELHAWLSASAPTPPPTLGQVGDLQLRGRVYMTFDDETPEKQP